MYAGTEHRQHMKGRSCCCGKPRVISTRSVEVEHNYYFRAKHNCVCLLIQLTCFNDQPKGVSEAVADSQDHIPYRRGVLQSTRTWRLLPEYRSLAVKFRNTCTDQAFDH